MRKERFSSRLIVYPPELVRVLRGEDSVSIGDASSNGSSTTDDYAGRLVKYVPAETIAFAAVFTSLDVPTWGTWVMFVVAVAGTPIYYSRLAWLPHFALFLTALAAVAWIIGTTSFGTVTLGLSYDASKAILFCATFLIPALDLAIQRRLEARLLN